MPSIETMSWNGSSLRLLDQTQLPLREQYVDVTTTQQAWDAIKRLVVRGAPAIGVAAAFGAYLGMSGVEQESPASSRRARELLNAACDHLATSRPTAVNLFWALNRVREVGRAAPDGQVKARVLGECLAMMEEDRRACRAIGENGLCAFDELVPPGAGEAIARPLNVLTHCNAGALATVAYGTALAPIYVGIERGRSFHVFADETRPLLQGSRITAFELSRARVGVTVLCDNMAASLMSSGRVDVVIVGADRIAANGDAANKIGTLGVAIVARHFNVPLIVAAPTSTIDTTCPSGAQIPIEHRAPDEVLCHAGTQTAPEGVGAFNPAFDVTPASLIGAIVTERGIARPPFDQSLPRLVSRP